MKTKYRLIIGMIGCLLLFIFGITRMLNGSLSTGSLIFALISAIGFPIAATAMAINYKRLTDWIIALTIGLFFIDGILVNKRSVFLNSSTSLMKNLNV